MRVKRRQRVEHDEASLPIGAQARLGNGVVVEIADEARTLAIDEKGVDPREHGFGVLDNNSRFPIPARRHDKPSNPALFEQPCDQALPLKAVETCKL